MIIEGVKVKKIVLSFICLMITICITGCNGQKQILKTEKDVYKYLKKNYPEETFEIIDKEEISINVSSTCGEPVDGNRWTVVSKETGIQFEVEDTYEYEAFVCTYDVYSEYKYRALKTYTSNLNDDRISFDTDSLSFDVDKFSSSTEALETINNTVNQFKNRYPLKYGKETFHVCITKSDKIIGCHSSEKQITISDINGNSDE